MPTHIPRYFVATAKSITTLTWDLHQKGRSSVWLGTRKQTVLWCECWPCMHILPYLYQTDDTRSIVHKTFHTSAESSWWGYQVNCCSCMQHPLHVGWCHGLSFLHSSRNFPTWSLKPAVNGRAMYQQSMTNPLSVCFTGGQKLGETLCMNKHMVTAFVRIILMMTSLWETTKYSDVQGIQANKCTILIIWNHTLALKLREVQGHMQEHFLSKTFLQEG